MLKRRIAVAIAGLFIGGAGLAAVEQDMFPTAANEQAGEALAPIQAESTLADAAPAESAQTEAIPAESTQGEGGMSIKSVQRYMKSLVAKISEVTKISAVTVVPGDTFPPSADDMVWKHLPVQAKYLEDRAAAIQMAAGSNGNVFAPSADEIAMRPLPALASYFEQKEANVNIASFESRAPNATE